VSSETNLPIPAADLRPQNYQLRTQLVAAVESVLERGQFILGPNVHAFEHEVADYLGVAQAIGVNSGTDALILALRALEIGAGDEVITTPFTFFATAEAISAVGADPVFVDIDPNTFVVEPEAVAAAITDRTRALIPVHLYGHAAPMNELAAIAEPHGLALIEDAAQSFGGRLDGRRLGTLGHVGALSFFPSKNLGGFGDGGMVTTDDAELAERVRWLRTHGSKRKYQNEMIGYNTRLDEVQAAMLRVKLPHVDVWNKDRQRVAQHYDHHLRDVKGVITPRTLPDVEHVFHQYTVRIASGDRDLVARKLREHNIGTMVYYPVPVHRLPVYATVGASLPMAEKAAGEVLSLPMFPHMTEREVELVAQGIKTCLR